MVSHKLIAQAAGLGKIGVHRNLIHPKFGNFILLGTVLLDAVVARDEQAQPLDYNPCLGCKLCVAACPVGAISSEGDFNFSACYTHNYREFMGGFTEWVERVADSDDAKDYRSNFSDTESASMWQSLSFGANYKAAYCLSVCPAGEDVIGPYLDTPTAHLKEVVKPLQQKVEPVYVIPGSDAEQHTTKRFPHKELRHVNGSLRPATIKGFSRGTTTRLPAETIERTQRDLSFHLHWGRTHRGDRAYNQPRDRSPDGTYRGIQPPGRSRFRCLVEVPPQRAPHCSRPVAPPSKTTRRHRLAPSLWQMLPELAHQPPTPSRGA